MGLAMLVSERDALRQGPNHGAQELDSGSAAAASLMPERVRSWDCLMRAKPPPLGFSIP